MDTGKMFFSAREAHTPIPFADYPVDHSGVDGLLPIRTSVDRERFDLRIQC